MLVTCSHQLCITKLHLAKEDCHICSSAGVSPSSQRLACQLMPHTLGPHFAATLAPLCLPGLIPLHMTATSKSCSFKTTFSEKGNIFQTSTLSISGKGPLHPSALTPLPATKNEWQFRCLADITWDDLMRCERGKQAPVLRMSGRAKLVRTPAMSTVAPVGRGRPLTSTPTSVVVPPAQGASAQYSLTDLYHLISITDIGSNRKFHNNYISSHSL